MSKPSRSNKKFQPSTKTNKATGKPTTRNSPGLSWWLKWGDLIFLAVIAFIVLQARIRLLAIPMERDEAGFAYIGHWLLKGKSLYIDMVDNKLLGLYVLYGFFTTFFGYNATGIHLGLLLANVVTGVCFFFLIRDLFNRFVASFATAFLVVLLVNPSVLGFAAHATQLLLPFALGGFLFFWKGIRSEHRGLFFISGLLLGFSFIIKQQSVVFGILAALLWWPLRLWWNKKENDRIPFLEWLLLGIGGLLPVAAVVGYFTITSRLDELYFWAVRQPSRMTSTFIDSGWSMFRHFVPIVIGHVEWIWMMAGAGLIFIFISKFQKGATWFGFLITMLGLGSVIIGAAYYQHYFILALPGIALLAAITLYWISVKMGKAGSIVSGAIFVILMTWTIRSDHEYFFTPDYNKIHQSAYGVNMFPEIERIGKELAHRVAKGSRIGIMGSEPGVLVAADREGCSRHLFMYPILSDPLLSPPMQNEYLQDMQECQPEYIVWNVSNLSWASGYNKLGMFVDLNQWLEQNYATIGLAEYRDKKPGELVWDEKLKTFQSQNEYKIYVFKRK